MAELDWIAQGWTELSAYSIPECIAVFSSLCYVILAARGNRYCWPAAFVGSAIYVVVFWQYQLLMESALNVYYVAMAVYGWLLWNSINQPPNGELNTTSPKGIQPSGIQLSGIQKWRWQNHALSIGLVALFSLTSGYLLSKYSDAAFPYIDSLTTWSSLLATWMVAKKILENWLYWIVIDLASMALFYNKGLLFTTGLFALYVVIAIYGYRHWHSLKAADYPTDE